MPVVTLTPHDRETYQNFVRNHPLGSIHQTWEWAEFQAKNVDRDRFWILAQRDDAGNIQASVLLIRQKLPHGLCWLYAPRGPLIDPEHPESAVPLFAKIAEIAQAENAVFFRFDPPIKADTSAMLWREFLQKNRARVAHHQYQPQDTLMLDLAKSPEELLQAMKPKGRYNIKVAQKHGVKIRVSESEATSALAHSDLKLESDLANFDRLLRETTSRDGFSGHPIHYYRDMLMSLGPQQAKLYLAEYEQKAVAAIITTYFKNTATYYFGASSNEYRQTMAPYLLQWQAILDAQKAGYRQYDFLGIAPQNPFPENPAPKKSAQNSTQNSADHHGAEPTRSQHHPLAGVTDFKLKFGGERVTYFPAQEIVYRPFWYASIKAAKWLRSLRG